MAFSLNTLFSKEAKSVLGVDIGTSAIKVVQLRKEKGRVILETYGAISLGPYAGMEIGRATSLSSEKIAEALKDVIREANVTTQDAAVSIPYSSSLISIIKLPSSVEKQLAQVVPLEARKYIPVPINEVLLDWFVVSGGAKAGITVSDKIDVLLVAIHNDTIAKFRNITATAALNVGFFEIEVFSAVRAALDHGLAPVAVVDLGAATTKFYVVERGLIHESHIINHGAQDLTLAASRALNIPIMQAEERKRKIGLTEANSDLAKSLELTLGTVVSEISRTLVGYEQRTNQTVTTLVATGGGASLKGFKEFAKDKIQAEIRLADPFGKTQTPAFLENILKDAGPEFAVAVGLALRRLQEVG